MARHIIRLPGRFSRLVLRLLSATIAFVFTFFVYATGQVTKTQTSGDKSAVSASAVAARALSGLDDPVLEYGIGPLYGVVDYGMPYADFSVKGVLRSDKSNLPIPGIQVTLQDTATKEILDTVTTAAGGDFTFDLTGRLPTLNTWVLTAVDVDGNAHGSFAGKDTLVTIPQDSLTGGSGFYAGSGEVNIEMYLDENASQVIPRTNGENALGSRMEIRKVSASQLLVEYPLAVSGHVRLGLYGADGKLVCSIVDGAQEAGRGTAAIDASMLRPGTYYLKLTAGRDIVVSKIAVPR